MKEQMLFGKMTQAKEIADKYDMQSIITQIDNVQSDLHDFTLKILFVGQFSAGKSAILNAFMGRTILEEGMRPETAIAGELVYDANEYVEAVNENEKKKFDLCDVRNIENENYNYLIWHLNNENLKKISGCTLVDMPGFNSGIANHNKAILQYSGRGNAYIFVIDSEEGTIKQNMAEFVNEIKQYDDNIAIAISKSDLKLPEDVEKIENGVREEAEMTFGETVNVISTSKYDEEVQTKINSLINSFDKEKIYLQEFVPRLYDILLKISDSLEIYKRNISLDVKTLDKEIKQREKSKQTLVEQLDKKNGALENKFKNFVLPSIYADIQNALYSQVDNMANSASSGGQAFSMTVNNILRPVLLSSTQKYVEQSFSEYLDDICVDLNKVDDAIDEISKNVIEKYRNVNDKLQELAQNSDKYNAIYKTITTTLSVATSVVAPWLELLIIFLPDILKIFAKGNQNVAIKNQINDQVIPQIVEKLKPEIEKSMLDVKDKMITTASDEVKSLIDLEVEALDEIKSSRQDKINQYNQRKEDVEKDIDIIANMINELNI